MAYETLRTWIWRNIEVPIIERACDSRRPTLKRWGNRRRWWD